MWHHAAMSADLTELMEIRVRRSHHSTGKGPEQPINIVAGGMEMGRNPNRVTTDAH